MKRIWMAGAVACALMTSVIPAKAFGDHAEHARMRHDRPCDKFQDRKDLWKLSPRGGNAVRFGLCGGIEDIPIGANTSPGGFWGAYNCGYQAYRERKRSDANPYKNDQKKKGWNEGWEDARKFCTTGQLPSIGLLDAHRKLCVKDPVKYAAASARLAGASGPDGVTFSMVATVACSGWLATHHY